jgi:hypothetical protein
VLLIHQHTTFRPEIHDAGRKTQPLDAAQSKLILQALAGAEWTAGEMDFRMTPWRAFNLLGAKPGWNPAQHGVQDRERAARQWLSENAETFRVQTFVRK